MKNKQKFHGENFYGLIKLLRFMRITVFILFLAVFQTFAVNAYSQKAKISLNCNNRELVNVLDQIENTSSYFFIYNEKLINTNRNVSISAKNQDIEEILDQIFEGTGVLYTISDRKIILSPDYKTAFTQQQKNITGKVIDSSGEPLPGVTVVVKGTTQGTITDINGHYNLLKVKGDAILVFSFIGMKVQEFPVKDQSIINVTMAEESIGLNEVVAVGYGTQKKVNLTGSVSAVNMDKIVESRPVTNISSALSGVVPGVFITSDNNSPSENGNASIMIRGQGTLNNSSPLVIIDGVEGSFNSVNPQDVESVSVLKDAASSAIYGSRAANGVILINTKKGKEGKIIFNYSGQVSIESVSSNLDVVTDYADYMELYNEGATNSGQGTQFSQAKIDEWRADGGTNPLKYPNNDWQDYVFNTGVMNQHNFSVGGGTAKIHFHASYNYLNNPGVVDNSGYKKHSMRVNLESEVNDWFTFGTQLSGYTSDTQMGSSNLSDVFVYAAASTPGMVFESPDGRYGTVNNSEDDPQANNILTRLHNISGEDKSNSVKTRFYGEFRPVKGLTINTSYVYDFYDRKKVTKPDFVPIWDFYTNTMVSDGVIQTYIKNQNWNTYRNFMDAYANYKTSFINNKLDFSIMGGASQEKYRSDNFSAYRKDLIDSSLGVIDGAVGESSTSGAQTEWAMRSYFGRLNMGWQDKYLFEANLRADGSSRFISDNRWGYFPSFSLGWRIIQEDFMSSIDWVSNLKLRGSYGSLGNNSVGNYDAISSYSTRNYVLNNSTATGLAIAAIANSDLTWESTYITDIGIDFGLFKNKLTGTFDYFDKVTKDILIDLPAPDVHGGASIPKQNAAQVSNKGFELMLSYNGNIGKDFSYGVSGNVTYVKNNVDKFKGDVASYSGDHQILEGRTINEKYVLQFDRIVQTDEDVDLVDKMIANAPIDETTGEQMNPFSAFGRPEKGDVLYKDMNGDGLINNDDRFMTGYNNLNNWIYGVSINASYKGFDFSTLIQGAIGARETASSVFTNYSSSVRYGYQMNSDIVDGRYYEGRDVANDPATFPRLLESSMSGKNNELNSTFWMAKKSYMRIKNIQLGYTVPQMFLAQNKLSALHLVRVYCSLENFFTFTNWPGLDPEVSGVDYPVIKQCVFGLNVSF